MGWFNYLFGSRRSLVREELIDEQKIIGSWEILLKNHEERENLSKFFSHGNINTALTNLEELDKVLNQIEELIPKDLVEIENDEKLESEIIRDLEKLAGTNGRAETTSLCNAIASQTQKQEKLKKLLKKIYDVLQLELHLLKKIHQRTSNMRSFLSGLFTLIFHEESELYSLFRERYYFRDNMEKFSIIKQITRAVILEQTFDEGAISAEMEFVNFMANKMGPDSRHRYRKLGENIFHELIELAETRMTPDFDFGHIITEVEHILENVGVMREIIIRNRGRMQFTEEQINWTIKAFRRAYTDQHFEDLEVDYTKRFR